ncbi:uncharacterized protein TRIADDRAFT_52986 [Trichoplax adhaerens]|uniref:SH3 domain-containing protein n=1 Tax=Trichoplax adhaerens TaxID=10228 RepID=B3RN01_TRIAD|nr:hypothetical protein TRIADDRAFT_52986 [Trichoplax adhaerens]EDV27370.1 hypothetical protein TRIADDRAFT_52986 [Trichoplax adhaerens]|eukprot:XP_002109204.1 hypothetical protein TRIADDRAFT_52986 [Trichoplax adhaerens]
MSQESQQPVINQQTRKLLEDLFQFLSCALPFHIQLAGQASLKRLELINRLKDVLSDHSSIDDEEQQPTITCSSSDSTNQLSRDSGSSQRSSNASNIQATLHQDGTFLSEGLGAKNRYKAEYDHAGRDDTELTFVKNEIISIGHKLDENWWIGLKDGIIGLVPSAFLRPTW